MILRIKVSLIATILVAGSWCLAQTKGNIFWLGVSLKTYLTHIGIWVGFFIFTYLTLFIISKRSIELEWRLALFIIIVSLLNLMDYGLRGVFGPTSAWSKKVIVCWAAFTIIFPVIAAYISYKICNPEKSIKDVIHICIIPCILLLYYALPKDFVELSVDKPFRSGNRPPVHLILFDMLSYENLFKDGMVDSNYPNFRSFSLQSDIFLNCYSPGESTNQVIPKLLAGTDFVKINHAKTQWLVQVSADTEIALLSSFENLFSLAYEAGYNVFLQAFAFPYINNFEKYIQHGKIFPFDSLWRVGMHSLVWPIISPGGIQHQKTAECILNNYLARIKDNSWNTLFYTHWNIPHDPFIFNSNGRMLNRFGLIKQLIMRPERKISYFNQLVGTDAIFGQLISAMKDNGTYDKSLIIVTADTNVKDLGLNMRHVPLFIKRPNQSRLKLIKGEVTTLNLKTYLKHFFQTGICDEKQLQAT